MPTGSCTEKFYQGGQEILSRPAQGVYDYRMDWVSTSGGSVSFTGSRAVVGIGPLRAWTIPSASAAPTDNYDVTLKDDLAVDVLNGGGANRDTANTEELTAGAPLMAGSDGPNSAPMYRALNGVLTLDVSNAGNAKEGSVVIRMKA